MDREKKCLYDASVLKTQISRGKEECYYDGPDAGGDVGQRSLGHRDNEETSQENLRTTERA